MAVIKLNSGGQVILRGGLPSCTCCGLTLYVEHLDFYSIYPSYVISYFTMTGTVGSGFTGTGPGGVFTLIYNVGAGRWFMTDPLWGISSSIIGGSTDPAAPAGVAGVSAAFYEDADTTPHINYQATVALAPLP